MKKLLYVFILSLTFILPMKVSAAQDKNKCTYEGEHLRADMVIKDDGENIFAELIIYEFNVDKWETGKDATGFANAFPIKVRNYSSSDTVNNITIAAYSDYKNYTCPKYLLVEDDMFFDGFVSDNLNDLTKFKDGFMTGRKFIGEIAVDNDLDNGTNPPEPDADKKDHFYRECIYKREAFDIYVGANGFSNTLDSAAVIVDKGNVTINVIENSLIERGHLVLDTASFEYKFDLDKFRNKCPEILYYNPITVNREFRYYYQFYTEYSGSLFKLGLYHSSDGDSNNNTYDPEYDDDEDDVNPGESIIIREGCDIISSDLKNWLIQLLDLIKVGGLILTLILGMLDFFKAAASNDADAMKKVSKSFLNRMIAVIILFLLPLIIEFIFGLINVSGINSGNPLCGIK